MPVGVQAYSQPLASMPSTLSKPGLQVPTPQAPVVHTGVALGRAQGRVAGAAVLQRVLVEAVVDDAVAVVVFFVADLGARRQRITLSGGRR